MAISSALPLFKQQGALIMKERLLKELAVLKTVFTRMEFYERENYYLGGFIAGTGHILLSLGIMIDITVLLGLIKAYINNRNNADVTAQQEQ
jgi:hypothetical protein